MTFLVSVSQYDNNNIVIENNFYRKIEQNLAINQPPIPPTSPTIVTPHPQQKFRRCDNVKNLDLRRRAFKLPTDGLSDCKGRPFQSIQDPIVCLLRFLLLVP